MLTCNVDQDAGIEPHGSQRDAAAVEDIVEVEGEVTAGLKLEAADALASGGGVEAVGVNEEQKEAEAQTQYSARRAPSRS